VPPIVYKQRSLSDLRGLMI